MFAFDSKSKRWKLSVCVFVKANYAQANRYSRAVCIPLQFASEHQIWETQHVVLAKLIWHRVCVVVYLVPCNSFQLVCFSYAMQDTRKLLSTCLHVVALYWRSRHVSSSLWHIKHRLPKYVDCDGSHTRLVRCKQRATLQTNGRLILQRLDGGDNHCWCEIHKHTTVMSRRSGRWICENKYHHHLRLHYVYMRCSSIPAKKDTHRQWVDSAMLAERTYAALLL